MQWRRLPLGIVGAAGLVAGIWGGLIRIGWQWYIPSSSWITLHGPLMVCVFLGTLIGMERAVALGRWWGYGAPFLSALGGVALLLSLSSAPLLLSGASLTFLALTSAFLRRQWADFLIAGVLGAASWVAGMVRWMLTNSIAEAVPAWMAFLVLTIAAERLELSRIVQRSVFAHRAFGAIAIGWLVIALLPNQAAWRVCALILAATALWLARYDIARWTIRTRGIARFAATALLLGYGWLAVTAIGLAIEFPAMESLHYDAILHMVFIGFVFSMIFAHAPIILPAVIGLPIEYQPALYIPLALLHGSVMLRVAGDWLLNPAFRRWGGLLSALAIVLYVVVTITSRQRTKQQTLPHRSLSLR